MDKENVKGAADKAKDAIKDTAGLGNVNPMLYSLAATQPNVFHDITLGNNYVPCVGGTGCQASKPFGYAAGVGYDLVTGLGSLDVGNLVTAKTSAPVVSSTLDWACNQ